MSLPPAPSSAQREVAPPEQVGDLSRRPDPPPWPIRNDRGLSLPPRRAPNEPLQLTGRASCPGEGPAQAARPAAELGRSAQKAEVPSPMPDRIETLWREAYEEGVTPELVRELLQLDRTQAQVRRCGLTLLQMAAGHHCHDGIALLLANGAEVNAVDYDGETPLHRAAWTLDPAGCRQLLDAGADSTMRDCYGRTPLDVAINGTIQASREDWEATQRLLGPA
jgi:hypothetical protein